MSPNENILSRPIVDCTFKHFATHYNFFKKNYCTTYMYVKKL